MVILFNNSFSLDQASLFRELGRIDLKLKEKTEEARQRDKYWQNNSIRGLFISETEITDLLRKPLEEKYRAAEDFNNASSATQDPASDNHQLDFLVKQFRLSDFEKDVILLALLPELDISYERIFGYIQDDVTRRKPSISLALDILCRNQADKIASRASFSHDAPLIRQHFIEIQEDAGHKNSSLLSKSIRLDERTRDFILGFDSIDANLSQFTCKCVPVAQLERFILPEPTRNNLFNIISTEDYCSSAIFYFHGDPGAGKRTLVDSLLKSVNTSYIQVETPALLLADLSLEKAFALLKREAILSQIPVFFHDFDLIFENEHAMQLFKIYFTGIVDGSYSCPLFLSGSKPWKTPGDWPERIFIPVGMINPGYDQRKKFWQSNLISHGIDDAMLAAGLSSKFAINIGQINQSMKIASQSALFNNSGQIRENDLYEACRQVSSRRLSELAQKIEIKYTWDDIVLPPEKMTQLREICNHVKYRHIVYNEWGFEAKVSLGKGLNALFAGPSGTGKTMSAGIMADELKLDLYKIDLSSVVSKYIGETEKNLSHIFTEAQNSNSILFFDEADSLFGKRSEVRDAHDRYANIETAYLLQKMEEYEGIVILATNLGKNIDEAFTRRMHFSIEFPFPDTTQRLLIWKKAFPGNAPLAQDIDFEFMARQFQISGGNIKNIALASAFLASAENSQIRMEHLILATRREYQKLGKLCTEIEFKEFYEFLK